VKTINYNFDVSVQGGTAAREQLPIKMTAALGAVRSTPNAEEEDEQLLMGIGQVLNYYLEGIDDQCFVDVHVSRNTMPNGQESMSVVVQRRPFTPPITAENPAWDPSQGPFVPNAASPGVAARRAAAAPAASPNAPAATPATAAAPAKAPSAPTSTSVPRK
jgi:hypothetical protein